MKFSLMKVANFPPALRPRGTAQFAKECPSFAGKQPIPVYRFSFVSLERPLSGRFTCSKRRREGRKRTIKRIRQRPRFRGRKKAETRCSLSGTRSEFFRFSISFFFFSSSTLRPIGKVPLFFYGERSAHANHTRPIFPPL